LDKFRNGPIDDRQQLLAELGVDEALDLLALRRVAFAARRVGQLRAGEDVEEREHPRICAGVTRRQLAVEDQPHGEIAQAIPEILAQLHASSFPLNSYPPCRGPRG